MTARIIQVTLGAGATQLATSPTYFNQMVVQNNASAAARFGGASVTSTTGIALGASGGSVNIGPFSGQQGDVSQFWVIGTSNDVIDILLV